MIRTEPHTTDLCQPTPARITSHHEAIAAAQRLAADWGPKAARRDAERILPFAEIDAFTASGLGAITVPKEFGGSVAPAAQNVDPNSYKWLKLGDHELHVVERDTELAKRLGVSIDPIKAHFAFTIESVERREELIQRLTDAGVKWMDWSPHGIPGKYQLFFLDPGNNLIEFQVSGPQQ